MLNSEIFSILQFPPCDAINKIKIEERKRLFDPVYEKYEEGGKLGYIMKNPEIHITNFDQQHLILPQMQHQSFNHPFPVQIVY